MKKILFLILLISSFIEAQSQSFCDSKNSVLVLLDDNRYMLQQDVGTIRFDLYFLTKETEAQKIIQKLLKIKKKSKHFTSFNSSVKKLNKVVLMTGSHSRYCRRALKEGIEIIEIIEVENKNNNKKPYKYILGRYYI